MLGLQLASPEASVHPNRNPGINTGHCPLRPVIFTIRVIYHSISVEIIGGYTYSHVTEAGRVSPIF